MNNIDEIKDFLRDANEALDLFSRYYRVTLDDDGNLIDECGWLKNDPYSDIYFSPGTTFNEAAERLTDKYTETIDIFSEANKDGDYYLSLLEDVFLTLDDIGRNAIIKRVIREPYCFFTKDFKAIYESLNPGNTLGLFSHRISMEEDEADKFEERDEIEMYRSLPVISWLIENCIIFIEKTGILCKDYNICLKDIIREELNYIDLHLEMYHLYDKNGNQDESSKNEKKKNEFTKYRKKEAITALLEAAGLNYNITYKSEIQRFIYFLTSQGSIDDDIKNTSIANLYKSSNDTRSNDVINSDLDYVAERFKQIGLNEIATKIKNGKI